ncbi:MAG: hypothetical protein EXR71_17610 [Myxococcales bacterium]|nr:hypothetical protein [Myxococcales bacterium]
MSEAAHPHPSPLRLVPIFPASLLGDDVLMRGGRCFAVRHAGTPADGEVLVAVPEVPGRQVLVPRGFGRPLLGRPVAGGWRVEGTGEPCGSRRWLAVGGLAARVRPYALPVGPAMAAPPLRPGPSGQGAFLAIRPVLPLLTAAARRDGRLRRGPAAVAGPRIREVSPAAATAGVVVGMSVRLARRLCPGLQVVDAGTTDPVAQVAALLAAEVGMVTRVRGALVVRPGGDRVAEMLALAEAVALRVWQEVGVRLRMAFAADPVVAVRFTRLLDADSVAYLPASAGALWRRQRSASRRAGWSGQMVDVDGIVALARAVAARAGEAGRLQVDAGAKRFEVRCASAGAAAAVEAALRARAVHLGEVRGIRWVDSTARPAQQLPLLGGVGA